MSCCLPIGLSTLKRRSTSPPAHSSSSSVPMAPTKPMPSATHEPEMLGSLLCLKCRRAGHVAARCVYPGWARDEFRWFLSKERKAMRFGNPAHAPEQNLCKRCQDLNVPELLSKDLPWKLTSELNSRAREGINTFQSLGKTGFTEFW